MKTILTVTSKGQTTIPAPIRHKLGLESGGRLEANFNETSGELVISKPLSIHELSQKLSGYIKAGTKPLNEVDTFYRANKDE